MEKTVKTFLARVGLKPRGTFSEEVPYDYKDFFNHNGSSFVVLKKEGIKGVFPVADNINFMLLAERGEKLKFSDLTDEEKDVLKLHFPDLTADDIALLQQPAKEAAASADIATGKANNAADLANTNAGKADAAAKSANDAAGAARASSVLADEKAGLADAAAGLAASAAGGAGMATENANSAAAEARNVPLIQNGTFWLYDPAQKKYVDTGSSATGKSPKAIDGIWWEYKDDVGEYVSTNISASSDYELTKQKIENVLTGDITTHNHATELAAALAAYVLKVAGKDLSTNDFTNELKTKLENLSNYNDAAVVASITAVNQRLDTLVGGSASEAIDTFREIEAFLQGITDTKTLAGLLADLKAEITALIPTKLSQLTNDDNTVKDANYQHTDNNYTNAEKTKLSKINFVPTLDHEPGEGDISFSDADGEHVYLIGNQVRVFNAEKGEFVFWQLYDIAANKAIWKKAGSGGDMQLTEKVNITLSSNQAQPDDTLNGAVIHLIYGDNDTPFVWQNGSVFSADIPMNMTYRIQYPAIAGYATPETVEYIALAGNTRTVNAMYNTTIITIDVTSNQTDKVALNNLQITLSGSMNKVLTYTGKPLSLKIPTGKQIVISPAQVDGYATVSSVTKTPTASTDSVSFAYNTTITSISLTSNQGTDTALNGTNIVVKYAAITKNLTWQGIALSIKIPTGSSFSVSSGDIAGYNTPSQKTQTATGTTGSVSLAYTTEKATINVVADDGGSVAAQSLTVTNTSSGAVLYSGKAGTGIVLKIPFGTNYKVSVNAMSAYHPVSDQSFTAGSASRTVTVTYERIKTSRVVQDDSIADPQNITGDVNGTIIQQIRAKFRRCLAKKSADGQMTIRYLKNDNSNYYDDGTAAKLDGTEGDVMVYFPRFYYKYENLGSYKFAYSFALVQLDNTWKESSECLVGAYEAYVTNNKVYSRSGLESTRSISQGNYKAYSRARGTGYQIIDYDQHKIIAWLFYAIYGTRNCQAICGSGTNSYTKENGQTNNIGNADTTTANGNSMSVNFLGIENCWGNKYEWIDNVVVNNGTWVITDIVTGASRNVVGLQTNGSWGYAKTAVAGDFLDIIAKEGGMSDSTGYCDGFLTTTSSSRVVLRSYVYSNSNGGVACAYASYDSSGANSGCGSRLSFRGEIREAESVSAFKAISITN